MSGIKVATLKTYKNIKTSLPIIIGVLMMINLVNPILVNYYSKLFTNNYFFDPLIWAVLWSISFWIPIVSYVTWWELLKEWVSLLAVSAFLISWSTVWVAMLALEISSLWKKFAIIRNILNFVTALIISVLTVLTINLF